MKVTTRGQKTDKVRDQVFSAILRGDYRPGDRLPTERMMAEFTGTSRVTIRRAYGELEEAGIIRRVQGSGASVATKIRGSRSNVAHIALLTAVVEPFALDFVRTLERVVSNQGQLFVLRLTREQPEYEAQSAIELVSKGLRSIVVWPSGKDVQLDTFLRLRVLGVNMVFFDRMFPGDCADFVGLDNRNAVNQLMEEAQVDGRTRLVFVSHDGLGVDSDLQREQAFLDYCMKERLPYSVQRTPWKGDAVGAVRRNRAQWFPYPKETAVICVNDEVALDVLAACGDEELAIYGVNGSPEALNAGIKTVLQPMEEMALLCSRLLEEQQAKGDEWRAGIHLCKGKLLRPSDPRDEISTGVRAHRPTNQANFDT